MNNLKLKKKTELPQIKAVFPSLSCMFKSKESSFKSIFMMSLLLLIKAKINKIMIKIIKCTKPDASTYHQ